MDYVFLRVATGSWGVHNLFFREVGQISNLSEICPVGAELYHSDGRTDGRTDGRRDGQTDMTKLTFVFRSFANAPKNVQELASNSLGSGKKMNGYYYTAR
jgi:hypothetical protein